MAAGQSAGHVMDLGLKVPDRSPFQIRVRELSASLRVLRRSRNFRDVGDVGESFTMTGF